MPSSQSALSDRLEISGSQSALSDNSTYLRISEAIAPKDFAWLSRESGVPTSTLGDIKKGKTPRTDRAIKIATAVGRSVEWLFGGVGDPTQKPIDTSEADFVGLPQYDLKGLTEGGKGHRIDTIPMRRDWLNRRFGTARGLWVAEMPSSYDELGLLEGDAVICSDLPPDKAPPDNTICFFFGSGLFVARYRDRWVPDKNDTPGPRVGPSDLADDARPIARIRSRMLTTL